MSRLCRSLLLLFPLLAWLALPPLSGNALAQARKPPPPPQTAFVQNLGAQLPLASEFIDDDGRAVHLAGFFGKIPVVLVPGYFHCPNLCSTVMEGVLETFAAIALPPGSYRLLAISIDPTENAAVAANKKTAYRAMLGGDSADLHLLTGKPDAIGAVMKAAGFNYAYDPAQQQYAHPAGFLIVTPDGRISRYFNGVRFNREDVRQALSNASDGKIGGLADRLLLLCAHYDPLIGRHSVAAMTLVRIVCLLLPALLALWIWRHRKHARTRRT
jgi:protein SCO1/2